MGSWDAAGFSFHNTSPGNVLGKQLEECIGFALPKWMHQDLVKLHSGVRAVKAGKLLLLVQGQGHGGSVRLCSEDGVNGSHRLMDGWGRFTDCRRIWEI